MARIAFDPTINPITPQFSNPQRPTTGKGSGDQGFLSSLISEGGALGGAALGQALIPIPLLGAGIGAAIGGGLGQLGENQVRDNQVDVGKALQEAALSGVFAAGPLRLGKAALATRGAAKAAGTGITKAALQEGLEQGAKFSLLGSLGKGATKASGAARTRALNLSAGQQAKILKKTGVGADDIARKFNILGIDDITKNIDIKQSQFDDVIKGISSAASKKNLKSEIAKAAKELADDGIPANKEFAKRLLAEGDDFIRTFGDQKDVAFSALNAARKQYDKFIPESAFTDPSKANVYRKMRDVLAKVVREAADDSTLKTTGKGTLKNLGGELNQLYTLKDEAVKKVINTGGGSILGLRNLMGAAAGGAGAGPGGALAGAAVTGATNSTLGRKAVAKTFEGLGGALTRAGTSNIGQLAGRGASIGGANLIDSLLQSQSSGNGINDNTIATSDINSMNPNDIGALSPQSAGLSTQGQVLGTQQPNDLVSALSDANTRLQLVLDNINNPDALGQLEFLFSIADQANATQDTGGSSLSSTQQQQANNAVSALNDIQTIKAELTRDPSVAGKSSLPFDSLTNRITGAGSFEAAKNNVVDALARLRSGAAITDFEFANFSKLIPQTFDSPELAQQKLARLEQLFASFANPQGVPEMQVTEQGAI